MAYLGLDIGTGACKAVVFSGDGFELASAHREYSLVRPRPDWAELDSVEVMDKCFEVIREVNLKTPDSVTAMSISSQGEAFTPVGYNGKTLGNAMVSSDARAGKIALEWSERFGTERIYRITGHTPHPLFSLYKILWLKENQPEIWNNTRYLLCFEDLFHYHLGLEPKISWPLAGRTMLFDVIKHQWSRDILDASGIMEEKLAVPVPSGETVGTIAGTTAEKLGFNNPVRVVAGGHDQTCAALGAGVVEPGSCMYATGTVECFCPVLEKPTFSAELQQNNLCCYDYTLRDKYTTVAYCLTGGSILRWMRDELGQHEISRSVRTGENPYSLLLDAMPAFPTNLLVLPYFSATGTPYFDTSTRGAMIGLRDTTTKGEITRALLEGVAMEMKLNLELMEGSGMEISTFIATGGGTRNNAWLQLKADVLNKKILVPEVKEAGCFGAALLAQSAAEDLPVVEIVQRNNFRNVAFYPNQEHAAIFEKKFESYKKLYPALKQFPET